MLSKDESIENVYSGVVGKWKHIRLKKLKEEYDELIEISQYKYVD